MDINGNPCIVVVEDDTSILNFYEELLKQSLGKCNVKTFEGIDNDLFKFVKDDKHIDLFIIDVVLGESNGIELCEGFLETMSGLTFLFMSGYDYNVDAFKVFDGKCIYDFLSKPIDNEEFVIRVKALLNVSKSYNRVLKYLEQVKTDFLTFSADNLRHEYFKRVRDDQQMIRKIKGEIFSK
jgi:DNA-binding response OmpR family regulator